MTTPDYRARKRGEPTMPLADRLYSEEPLEDGYLQWLQQPATEEGEQNV